jgi:hypothetical protein
MTAVDPVPAEFRGLARRLRARVSAAEQQYAEACERLLRRYVRARLGLLPRTRNICKRSLAASRTCAARAE